MSMVPIPNTPGWAVAAARHRSGELQRLTSAGFEALNLFGALLAAASIGAAVLGALPGPARRDEADPYQ